MTDVTRLLRFALVLIPSLLAGQTKSAAPDVRLSALRATLLPFRTHLTAHPETRGATIQFNFAKHQLRDWIELQLLKFPQDGHAGDLQQEMDQALSRARLYCDHQAQIKYPDCDGDSRLGFLGGLYVSRRDVFLIVQTHFGVQCGYDESIYLYEWREGRWRRRWQYEQSVYTKEAYAPQTIDSVSISPADKDGYRLILTLGTDLGCSVVWNPVFYHLWRLPPDQPLAKVAPAVKPLIEESAIANLSIPAIHGGLTPEGMLIEFTVHGVDPAHDREAIRHFSVQGGKVERIDPVALTPREFVEAWFEEKWPGDAPATISDSASRAELQKWYAKLHGAPAHGQFAGTTMHCTDAPDLWELGIKFDPGGSVSGALYFQVRWTQPNRFTMVHIGDHPSQDCAREDLKADQYRTLFP